MARVAAAVRAVRALRETDLVARRHRRMWGHWASYFMLYLEGWILGVHVVLFGGVDVWFIVEYLSFILGSWHRVSPESCLGGRFLF